MDVSRVSSIYGGCYDRFNEPDFSVDLICIGIRIDWGLRKIKVIKLILGRRNEFMPLVDLGLCIVSGMLFLYLMYALLFPEKF